MSCILWINCKRIITSKKAMYAAGALSRGVGWRMMTPADP